MKCLFVLGLFVSFYSRKQVYSMDIVLFGKKKSTTMFREQ